MLVEKENQYLKKSNQELPTGIRNNSSYSPLVNDDDLKMSDMSCGYFSLKNHTLSQQYCDSNDSDVGSGYDF